MRLADRGSLLVLNLHHIIGDAWSLDILQDEFLRCYAAVTRGEMPTLARPPVQYRDYAVFEHADQESRAASRAFWLERLASIEPVHSALPLDFERPAIRTFAGDAVGLLLDAPLVRRLRALGRRVEASLFMVLLAGWKSILHRVSGQPWIVVGSQVSGRYRLDLEGIVGFFANTVVLRTRIVGTDSFLSLLRAGRCSTLDAITHQSYPFDQLVEELPHRQYPNRNPLFDVRVDHSVAPPVEEIGDQCWRLVPVAVPILRSKYDLSIVSNEAGDDVEVRAVYNSDLFRRSTIERALGAFHAVLRAVVDDPDGALESLPLNTQSVVELAGEIDIPLNA